MVKRLFKFAALLMVVSMVLSLVACQTATPQPTTTAPATSASEATGQTTATPATSAPEATGQTTATPAPVVPVTLKYWTADGATGTSGIHDDHIMKELTRITGVTIDITFNIATDQRAAMLASGDLPDLMTVNVDETSAPGVPTLLQGGWMIDMEPLLAEHGKNMILDKATVQFGKDFYSNGAGKLYFVPTWGVGLDAKPKETFNSGTGTGLYLRWDLYKEAGYPELPANGGLNDIIPILKQMQDLHPTTTDGKKVYGLSPWLADWGLWCFTIWPQGLTNTDAESGGFVDIKCSTNAITSQILDTNSTLWQGAKFYFLANQAGVLDPDAVMQKYDQSQDKQNAGRALMSPCNWSCGGATAAFEKLGETDKGFMAIKLPANTTDCGHLYSAPFADRWAQGVTTKCKTPERAVDLLDFLHSHDGMRLLQNGVEGVDWKVGDDGIPHLIGDMLKVQNGGTAEEMQSAGYGGYTHLYGISPDGWDPKYNCQMSFFFNDSPVAKMATARPFEKDYVTHYAVEYPDQIFEKTLTDRTKVYDGTFKSMVAPAPDNIKTIDDNLTNYLLTQMVQIIMVADENAFNAKQAEIIQKCKDMGAQTAFDWHKQADQAAMDKVAAFLAKIK